MSTQLTRDNAVETLCIAALEYVSLFQRDSVWNTETYSISALPFFMYVMFLKMCMREEAGVIIAVWILNTCGHLVVSNTLPPTSNKIEIYFQQY